VIHGLWISRTHVAGQTVSFDARAPATGLSFNRLRRMRALIVTDRRARARWQFPSWVNPSKKASATAVVLSVQLGQRAVNCRAAFSGDQRLHRNRRHEFVIRRGRWASSIRRRWLELPATGRSRVAARPSPPSKSGTELGSKVTRAFPHLPEGFLQYFLGLGPGTNDADDH